MLKEHLQKMVKRQKKIRPELVIRQILLPISLKMEKIFKRSSSPER